MSEVCLVLSSNFHCKENDGTTGAAYLIQIDINKTQSKEGQMF
jgi:hypothetical protein